jgi:hypothetical protein
MGPATPGGKATFALNRIGILDVVDVDVEMGRAASGCSIFLLGLSAELE